MSEHILGAQSFSDTERHRLVLGDGRRSERQRTFNGAFVLVASLARLVRLNSGITSAAAALITASMVTPPVEAMEMVIITALVIALSNGGYALNDVCDCEIDKINQPGRPIPAGRIGELRALDIGIGNLVAAILLSVPLSVWCVTLTITDAVFLGTYAAWSKRLGLLKNILIGYLVASGFLIGAYNWDRIDPLVACLVACAFFGTIAREIVKDVQDMEGDHQYGARTLPIMFGPTIAYAATAVCLTLCLMLAAIPYFMGLINQLYLILLLVGVGIFLIGWRIRSGSARWFQYMIMAGSIVVLVAFAIGRT